MKKFMDEDFLLSTNIAKKLYHEYAENMPIVDYHCHINPMDIAKDTKYNNITELWLSGDHYKWRQMRSNGIDEYYITGKASDKEKFIAWARTLERAIGNPLYHWSHLELKRYFNYDGYLNEENAEKVYEFCNNHIANIGMSTRKIINSSNVSIICTTDDPIDDLKYHEMIAKDKTFNVRVLPTFRPDKAMNIEKNNYKEYVEKLENISEVKIHDFNSLINALKVRINFFKKHGCLASDHALEYIMYEKSTKEEVDQIFKKALCNQELKRKEIDKFKTAFMLSLAKQYRKDGLVMQLHYGCKRDNNLLMFEKLGPDTGYDCINNYAPSSLMADFMNELAIKDNLPKTIIYSLNPNDNVTIDSIIGCFQNGKTEGKIQHGSAWWFNDHKTGMIEQMTSLSNLGLLSNFIGMLTDSRSFLSYTRHEYFRRIMCNLIGGWVDNGEYPEDYKALEKIVKDISYNNVIKYFNM